MSHDLAVVLGTAESSSLEFKDFANVRNRLSDVAKNVCAFANDIAQNGGGDLLIGVSDDGEPTGSVDTTDETLRMLVDLRDNGQILDRPSMRVEVGSYKGHDVIRVRVEASGAPPVRYKGKCWVRPGPSVREASKDDERVLSERRRTNDGPFDSRVVLGSSLSDLDLELFRTSYLPSVIDPDVLADNGRTVEEQLASLHLALGTDSVTTPTALGLLVVGFDPTAWIPGAYVQFVRYQGVGMDAPISDEQELRGNVVDIATALEPLVKANLRSRVVEDGFRETQVPEYPFEALRELCMNALMHRNYETSYAPVRIAWFDDRVEIDNPGGPYGRVRTDNFDRVNDYRNPSLAAAMKSLGYVNRFGRGIGRTRAALESNGNPPPVFAVDDSSWSVTIRRSA